MAGTGRPIAAWRSSPAPWQVRRGCGVSQQVEMGFSGATEVFLGETPLEDSLFHFFLAQVN